MPTFSTRFSAESPRPRPRNKARAKSGDAARGHGRSQPRRRETSLKITRIEFKAGARPDASPLVIEPAGHVILVGPNNAGKSLTLREIEGWCWSPSTMPAKVVAAVDATLPETEEEALDLLQPFRRRPPQDQVIPPDHIWVAHHTFRPETPSRGFLLSLQQVREAVAAKNTQAVWDIFLKFYSLRLDGRTRFVLSEPKAMGELRGHPQNHLWALFVDNAARREVRDATVDAFGQYFVLDPTSVGQIHIRMSERAPKTTAEERGLDDASLAFHDAAVPITEFGDGVQAFTGLVSAALSLPHRIMLIDEPEAFLHPPLARRLGRRLALMGHSATLIAATHSAEFLMGCVEARPNTTIVRLTYDRGSATARSLPAAQLTDLMMDPLLRSTGALGGLFHRSVVVTEADVDRAFYAEVNRLLTDEGRGADDALFVNAQNWQTTARIAGPLRQLGIPAAVVVDLDAVVEPTGWPALYSAIGVTGPVRTRLEMRRAAIAAKMAALPDVGGQKAFKVLGVRALSGNDARELMSLLGSLSRYGVFVVPVGEVECWLSNHKVSRAKKQWLMRIFQSLSAVTAGRRDVWAFIDSIARWASNPNRKGMPS